MINILKHSIFLTLISFFTIGSFTGCSSILSKDTKDLEEKYIFKSEENREAPSKFIPYITRFYYLNFGNNKLKFTFLTPGYLQSFSRKDNRVPRLVFDKIFLENVSYYTENKACFALESIQNKPTDDFEVKKWLLELVDSNNQKYKMDYEHLYYGHTLKTLAGEGPKPQRHSGGVLCTKNLKNEVDGDFFKILARGFKVRFYEDFKEDPDDFVSVNFKMKDIDLPEFEDTKVANSEELESINTTEKQNLEKAQLEFKVKKKKKKNIRNFGN